MRIPAQTASRRRYSRWMFLAARSLPFSFVPFAFLVAVISNLPARYAGSSSLLPRVRVRLATVTAVAARACVRRSNHHYCREIPICDRVRNHCSSFILRLCALQISLHCLLWTEYPRLYCVSCITSRRNATVSRFYFLTIQSTFETFETTIKRKGDNFYI